MEEQTNKWIRDFQAEAALKDFGLPIPKLSYLPISHIDRAKGWENHARLLHPKKEDLIGQYERDFRKGDKFPAVVLFGSKPLYLSAGGNHRIEAAFRAGHTLVAAYLLNPTDDRVKRLLPRILNTRIGDPITWEDRVVGALEDVENYGTSVEDAANTWNVSIRTIRNRIEAKAMATRLTGLLLPNPEQNIPEAVLVKLRQFDKDENVLAKLAGLIQKYKLGTTDSEDLIKRVKDKETEIKRLAEIEEEEAKLRVQKKVYSRGGRLNKRQKLYRWISAGENIFKEGNTLAKHQITEKKDKEEAGKRLQPLAKILDRLAKEGRA